MYIAENYNKEKHDLFYHSISEHNNRFSFEKILGLIVGVNNNHGDLNGLLAKMFWDLLQWVSPVHYGGRVVYIL